MIFRNKIIRSLLLKPLLLCGINVLIMLSAFGQKHIFSPASFSDLYPLTKVNKIYQDQKGLIWLGTSTGLFSFDGNSYQLLAESESKNISHICTGSENEMLVGTDEGTLIRINFDTGKAKLVLIDAVDSKITGIVIKNDQLIISTYGNGLWTFSDNKWQRVSGLSDYSIVEIYDMEIDDGGRIYLGTDDGLCIISELDKKCEFITIEHGLPDNIVKVVATDEQGNIWLGFHQNGFCVLDQDKEVSHIFSNKWNFGAVAAIDTHLSDQVFIGTDDGFLLEYNIFSGKMNEVLTPPIKKPSIHDILVDKEANIWISDHQYGVRKSSLLLSFLELPPMVKSKNVQALIMDKNNHLWFTTEGALFECVFENTGKPKFTKHLDADVFGSSFISIYAADGAIWLGTFGMGLLYYQPESGLVRSFKEKHGLANDNVLSIAATKEKIWFATLGGVSEANVADFNAMNTDQIRFKSFHEEDGLGTEYIYQVKIDSHGNPWFASDGKGLTTLKNSEFINYSEKDGLDSKIIYSITEDENQNIWIATPKLGIYRFNGNSFENYGGNTGFKNKQISSLFAINNSLAIIHKFGIDLLRENELRSFGVSEGVSEINADLNAVASDQLGNIWLGHQTGVIKLNTSLRKNYQAEVLINRILVNLNPIEISEDHIMDFDENNLTFNYLGLWYSDPLKIRYEYKLGGITQDWVSSRDNFVTFPNLPSGKYKFTVRASANGHFEYAKTASYEFEIRAPYWEKPWFFITLFLVTIIVVGVVFSIRDKTLKKRARVEQEKIQFQFETLKSQINPHFLFNSFNTLISIIEEEPKVATEYVEKLSDFFRNILQLREKDVISLREEIELTMDYAFLQEKRFGQNFSLLINIPDQWLDTEIPPLTLQLLAENAIKHNIISSKKPLTLYINIDQDYIIVRNNIQLKRKAVASTSYGLENIIKRYQLISNTAVEVRDDQVNFIIRLPIIKK